MRCKCFEEKTTLLLRFREGRGEGRPSGKGVGIRPRTFKKAASILRGEIVSISAVSVGRAYRTPPLDESTGIRRNSTHRRILRRWGEKGSFFSGSAKEGGKGAQGEEGDNEGKKNGGLLKYRK